VKKCKRDYVNRATLGSVEVEVAVDSTEGWIQVTCQGEASIEGYLASFEMQLPLALDTECRFFLADHRKLTGVEGIPNEGVRRLAEWFAAHRSMLSGACSAVVVGCPVQYGLSRMFEAYVQTNTPGFTFRVFDDLCHAKSWLRAEQARRDLLDR